jgi:hypothetical protein
MVPGQLKSLAVAIESFGELFNEVSFKTPRREDVRVRACTEAATSLFAQFKAFCNDGVRTERPMSVLVSSRPVLETTNSGFVGYTLRQADDGLPVEEFIFYIESCRADRTLQWAGRDARLFDCPGWQSTTPPGMAAGIYRCRCLRHRSPSTAHSCFRTAPHQCASPMAPGTS